VPGTSDPVTTLFVSEDGAITTRTSGDYTGVDDNGSPWYMRGQLLLTNRLTIGALMKDLDSTAATAGGGVFASYDTSNQRVIVTYQGAPAAGTSEPNTLQVVIYASGEIDITIGAPALSRHLRRLPPRRRALASDATCSGPHREPLQCRVMTGGSRSQRGSR
jgi:hypothetical protein